MLPQDFFALHYLNYSGMWVSLWFFPLCENRKKCPGATGRIGDQLAGPQSVIISCNLQ